MKLSAIIIAKNAEKLLADAISSVSFADQIIVVDNNSSDRTEDIATYFKAEVVKTDISDFSQLRNLGLKKSQGDWVFYLDADEVVSDELSESIKNVIVNEENFSAYKIIRKNFYFGKYEWPHQDKLERLFKKNDLKEWYGKLHESPRYEGKIGILNGFLLHYTHKNLYSMLEKTIEWSKIEAELRLHSNHPKMSWWRFPRVIMTGFFDSYFLQGGWKVGTVGLVESIYQAFSMFITYARLWELQKKR